MSASAWASEGEVRDVYGLGLKRSPVYDGADRADWSVVPIINIQRKHLFARTSDGFPELGAWFEPTPGVRLGAALSLTDGRSLSDARLPVAGKLEDLGGAAALGPFVEARFSAGPVPMKLTARWRQTLSNDRGAQADARLTFGIYEGSSLRLEGIGQLTWANEDSLRSEYGIGALQSAASGLPVYDPGSGMRHASLGLRGQWTLTQQWSVVTSLEHRRLSRAVKDSPLVTKNGASEVTFGVLYRLH